MKLRLLLITLLITQFTYSQYYMLTDSVWGHKVSNGANFSNPASGIGRELAASSDGTRFILAEKFNDSIASRAGAIHVYSYDSVLNKSTKELTIVGHQSSEYLGSDVQISGDGSVIAFSGESGSNGYIKVYKYDGSSWNQKGDSLSFTSTDLEVSLNKDGSVLAIGNSYDDAVASNAGSVSIYELSNNKWTMLGSLITESKAGARFGSKVVLDDTGFRVATAAKYYNQSDIIQYVGYVKVYDYSNNNWTQVGSTLNGTNGSFAGAGLDLSNDGKTLIFGASGYGNLSVGFVKVYSEINNSWTQKGSTIYGTVTGGYLGGTVATADNGLTIAVGSQEGSSADGSFRIYQFESDWTVKFQQNGWREGSLAGELAMNNSGTRFFVGDDLAKNNGEYTGAMYIFKADVVTGSEKIKILPEYILSPNPSFNQVLIQGSSDFEYATIIDSKGSILLTSRKRKVDTSFLRSGIYFVRVHYGRDHTPIILKLIKK